MNGNLAADVAEAEGDSSNVSDEAPVRTAHQPVEHKADVVESNETAQARQVTPVEVVVAAVATETAVVTELHAATETPALAVEKAAKSETIVPVVPVEQAPAAPALLTLSRHRLNRWHKPSAPVEAAQAAPAASETVSLVEPVVHVEAPVQAPVETPRGPGC